MMYEIDLEHLKLELNNVHVDSDDDPDLVIQAVIAQALIAIAERMDRLDRTLREEDEAEDEGATPPGSG